MALGCCQPNVNSMILTCADSSNVAQLSNHASADLTRQDFGKLICLAGSRLLTAIPNMRIILVIGKVHRNGGSRRLPA
jgi:uncharacterized metal-binding protein